MRKPSFETAESEPKPKSEPWLRRSLSRAREQLSQAFSGAQPAAAPAQARAEGAGGAPGADDTQTIETARGRARQLLAEDREATATRLQLNGEALQPSAASSATRTGATPPPLPVRNGADQPDAQGASRLLDDPKLAAIKAKHASTKARLAAAKAQLAEAKARLEQRAAGPVSALVPARPSGGLLTPVSPETPQPTAASEDSGEEPIRTRTMARLLAQQGYPDRALSIYDELLADEADDPMLHAEVEELRTRQSDRALH